MNNEPEKPTTQPGSNKPVSLAGPHSERDNQDITQAIAELEKEPETHFAPSNPARLSFNPVEEKKTEPTQQPIEKSNKKKIVIILALAVVLAGIGSGIGFALWYNHPDKVVSDAIVGATTARTYISDGRYEFTDEKNKGMVSLAFSSDTDTPNFQGRGNAHLKVDYDKFKFNLAGSGLISDKGNLFFKFDGVQKAASDYIDEPEVKRYLGQSPRLKKDILTFAEKIDHQWIKLDKKAIQDLWEKYDYSKTKTCFTDAYNKLDQNPKTKQQVTEAYDKNRFISVKDKGPQSIDGVDSVRFDMTANIAKYYRAADAFEKTDFGKNLQKCSDQLTGEKRTAKQKQEDKKYRDKSVKDEQKQINKAKLSVWISRWEHQFTKASFIYDDSKEKTHTTASVNFKFDKEITAPEPKKSIPLKEFRADVDKLQADIYAATSDTDSLSPEEEKIDLVLSGVVEFQANNRGVVPTAANAAAFAPYVKATNKTNPLLLPDGYSVDFKPAPPVAAQAGSDKKRIEVWPNAKCDVAGEHATSGGTARQVAVATKLGSGKSLCVTN